MSTFSFRLATQVSLGWHKSTSQLRFCSATFFGATQISLSERPAPRSVVFFSKLWRDASCSELSSTGPEDSSDIAISDPLRACHLLGFLCGPSHSALTLIATCKPANVVQYKDTACPNAGSLRHNQGVRKKPRPWGSFGLEVSGVGLLNTWKIGRQAYKYSVYTYTYSNTP